MDKGEIAKCIAISAGLGVGISAAILVAPAVISAAPTIATIAAPIVLPVIASSATGALIGTGLGTVFGDPAKCAFIGAGAGFTASTIYIVAPFIAPNIAQAVILVGTSDTAIACINFAKRNAPKVAKAVLKHTKIEGSILKGSVTINFSDILLALLELDFAK